MSVQDPGSRAGPKGASAGGDDPGSEGFARRDRLLVAREFEAVRRHGAQARGRFLILYEGPGAGFRTRLGLAVPKRVGNAVTRNRVKRYVREAFRTSRGSLSQCCDMLVVARPAAAGATAAEISRELQTLDATLKRQKRAGGFTPPERAGGSARAT